MTVNLLAQISKDLKGDALNAIASTLGEKPDRTQTALAGGLAALIGGLANKASTAQDANTLLDILKRNNFDSGPFTDVSTALTAPNGITSLMRTGQPLLESLFGARAGSVTDWMANQSGVNRTSAMSILSLALPLVLGQVGKWLAATGWNVSNLMSLFSDQRAFLADAPAGLMAALTGATTRPATPPADRRPAAAYAHASVPRRNAWLWAVPLLLLIPLLLFFLTRRDEPRVAVDTTFGPIVMPPDRPVGTTGLGAFYDRRLPNGMTLRLPANGVENKLLAYIADPTKTPNTETWFTFDRLEFDTNSARLRPGSSEQLQNIARILQAYPNVKVMIGGYTDSIGDAVSNQRLSQSRAMTAMQGIASYGVDRSRLQAEGYGEQHPVATNNTESGRQRNRRIDIRVTQK